MYQYVPQSGCAVPFAFAGTAYVAPAGCAVAFAFRPPSAGVTANPDAYSVLAGAVLVVAAPGVLSNDIDGDGGSLTAHLDTAPAHGSVTLAADGSLSYTPATGFLGDDTWTYHARNEGGTDSTSATVTVTVYLPPAQRYENAGAGLPWGSNPARARATQLVFARGGAHRAERVVPWFAAEGRARAATLPLTRADRARRDARLAWDKAGPVDRHATALPWACPPRRRGDADLPWSVPPARRHGPVELPWQHPDAHLRRALLPWTVPPARRRGPAALPFDYPPLHRHRWLLPWGHGALVGWHVRGRDPAEQVPPVPWRYMPPSGCAVPLDFACPLIPWRGCAVPLRFGEAACYWARPRPRSYIVLNTITVICTATGHPVDVTAVEVVETIDSMHHTLSLTLADPDDLAWLTPQPAGPVEIEVTINGWLWTGIIETWSTERRFPGRAVTASGRARTALLDAPYAPADAYVETSDRTAAQLVDHELTSTGFTADYDTVDWLVPAGAWSYDSRTPAGAIQTIAAAAGAVARAHPADKVVEILPRWPTSPWAWSTASPDATVQADYVPRLVDGGGVDGMQTYEVQLPLYPGSAAGMPGRIRPGMLVEFSAASGWRAQVTAVRTRATVQQAGAASAAVVWHELTLTAPPDEPTSNSVLVSGAQVGVSAQVVRTGTAGDVPLPAIVDPLITAANVQLERGRNALAGGTDGPVASSIWSSLRGLLADQGRATKGNITAANADGSYTIATADGATIRARPQPGQTWTTGDGVMVRGGYIIDSAANLPGTTQYV